MKEGECDSFACARRPVRQTDFRMYHIAVFLYSYLDGIRCSWIIMLSGLATLLTIFSVIDSEQCGNMSL